MTVGWPHGGPPPTNTPGEFETASVTVRVAHRGHPIAFEASEAFRIST